jgi:hypothetical protein
MESALLAVLPYLQEYGIIVAAGDPRIELLVE